MMRKEKTGRDINDIALLQGTVLHGRYQIEEVYYWGHISISYLCRDLQKNIPVMIKEFCPYQAANRDMDRRSLLCKGDAYRNFYEHAKSRFWQECRIVERVSCFSSPYEGCTPAFEATFYENNSIYLVIRYVEGVNLSEALEEQLEIRTFEILCYLIDIVQGIQTKGILHRDIKPSNLIVRNDGKITLIDFGAACYENEKESPLLFVSRGYSAPELYQKQNGSKATDVYSLGCLIYYLLTGYQLPAADDMEGEEVPSMSEFISVSKELDAVVLRMLDRNPYTRFEKLNYLKKLLILESTK